MKRFELFGNKKNIETQNGKMIISKSQEREFIEIGIIDETTGTIQTSDGIKIPYTIGETETRIFQFHKPRTEWGRTYNLISEPLDEGGRRKVIFVPHKSRFEIWELPKGGNRQMIMRRDGLDKVDDIVDEWNDRYDDDIDVTDLEAAIR
jgi:hypothetical protein